MATEAVDAVDGIKAGMAAVVAGEAPAPVTLPSIADAAAQARAALVHAVQRACYEGGPQAAEGLLAWTALLDLVLVRLEDAVERGVPLDAAAAGVARARLLAGG